MKVIHEQKGKIVTLSITRNDEFDYILTVKVLGVKVIELNLNEIFLNIREYRDGR